MVFPAAVFLAFNWGQPGHVGWGIPMATDIAFCVGCLTLLKRRVPHPLIVFVTALAIFDDIGGILVIALFYGHGLSGWWLAGAASITAGLWVMNRRYVRSGLAYAAFGAVLWGTLHQGGVHATISGVILGMMIPARSGDGDSRESPLSRFEHGLHPYVAFFLVPAFALANAGVSLSGIGIAEAMGPVALGTGLGLVLGKLAGVFLGTWIAVKAGLAPAPGNASWTKLLGVSAVTGIGFTVALFIASLAFLESPQLLNQAKIGILTGSLVAGVLGAAVLRATEPVGTNPSDGERGASQHPAQRHQHQRGKEDQQDQHEQI
jgi:NhaA family Na+:H+ antiporter